MKSIRLTDVEVGKTNYYCNLNGTATLTASRLIGIVFALNELAVKFAKIFIVKLTRLFIKPNIDYY